ncbi:MAG: lamin tail domain-containing protein [Actinomycetota bacterium]
MRSRLLTFAAALAVATIVVLVVRQPWTNDTDSAQSEPEDGTPGLGPLGGTGDTTPRMDPGAALGTPTGAVMSQPPSTALEIAATRIADGDSFEFVWVDPRPDGVRRDEVRLIGINAPEFGACFGNDSRNVLEGILRTDEQTVIEIVEIEDGGFGRLLANLWITVPVASDLPEPDDPPYFLVNLWMVESGAALALRNGGPFAEMLANAQARASENRRGLWETCTASTDVAITDLLANAPGRDDLNPNGEWIELVNRGDATIELTGWGLRDESTRHRYTFPTGFLLGPHDTVRVGSGCESDENPEDVDLFWCATDPVWNNAGDTAFLVDADGRFVDEWSYDG